MSLCVCMCVCMYVVGPRLIDGRGVLGRFGGFWWVLVGFGGFWGVLGGGADNVLGCPPYKIFSWTCCYAIHSSLAPYPATRYQLLLVTCKTLLIFALLFLGGGWGGLITFLAARLTRYSLGLAATLCTSLATYLATRYQLLLVTYKTLLIFALLFLGGVGGANNVLGCPPYKIFSWTCCYAMHFSCNVPCHTLSTSSCNLQDILDFCIVVSWGGLGGANNVLGCLPYKIMSQNVHSMIQQWMWRQTILPCSPKELMSRLVDLLKKHHDFQ